MYNQNISLLFKKFDRMDLQQKYLIQESHLFFPIY